ncbi:conserved hypothetical protein [Trichinella spiralis]|uniref:hypothetical protein n=1 Tax=Trichinella spiralis TaxID=6334 RepID=UPI0001EFE25F|nr:conserved hypothetical protein [Trichinella spiralis]
MNFCSTNENWTTTAATATSTEKRTSKKPKSAVVVLQRQGGEQLFAWAIIFEKKKLQASVSLIDAVQRGLKQQQQQQQRQQQQQQNMLEQFTLDATRLQSTINFGQAFTSNVRQISPKDISYFSHMHHQCEHISTLKTYIFC